MRSVYLAAMMLVATGMVMPAAALEFTVAKPTVVAKPMTSVGVDDTALQKALAVHNAMNEMRTLLQKQKNQEVMQKNLELQQKKMKAMQQCNIKRLAKDFKNPEDVWKKMTDEYDTRERDLAIYINSADDMTDEQRATLKENLENGYFSDESLAEVMAYWDIGNDILTDVYANQDKWGERLSPDAASLPLWEDQKYIFDKEWNQKYEAINLYFGVPPNGRPLIGEERYDYKNTDQLQAAHDAYLAALTAKNPVKAALMPPEMREAMVAPKPLPPKEESVMYIETDDPEKRVYPALPEPWRQYQADHFRDINPNGEMASDFSRGLELKDSAKNRTSAEQNNRLTVYQALKKELDGAEKMDLAMKQSVDQTAASVQQKLMNNLDLSGEVDLTDSKAVEDVMNRLRAEKDRMIALAEAQLAEEAKWEALAWDQLADKQRLESSSAMVELSKTNPAYYEKVKDVLGTSVVQRNRELLTALKKDTEAVVAITPTNAKDIDRKIREARAEEALLQKRDEWEKELAAEEERPIDDLCINGGV